ncbi:MAG: LysM peptidoglycan-binding domain-containing protein [Devosiaceae bacterium]|nr:LysM peptidoglycan-binding domain-containing protein [Devosiaceae bacterium MH13]
MTLVLGLIVLAGGFAFGNQFLNRPQSDVASLAPEAAAPAEQPASDQTADAATPEPEPEAQPETAAAPAPAESPEDSASTEDMAPEVTEAEEVASEAVEEAVTEETATVEPAAPAAPQEPVTDEAAAEEASDPTVAEEVETAAADPVSPADDQASTETAVETSEETAAPVAEPTEPSFADLTAPTLDIVRIEPTGEALIAGNAGLPARIGLLHNGDVVAETNADGSGDFVLVPDMPLPVGDGTLQIAILGDDGVPALAAEEEVAVVVPQVGSAEGFLVGILRPGQPVEIIEREAPRADFGATEDASVDAPAVEEAEAEAAPVEDVVETAAVEPTDAVEDAARAEAPPTVVIDAIELEGQRIWIAGAAEPGTVVRLYQDNALLGETRAGPEGRYLFEGTLSDAEGQVTVRADALAPGSADVLARAVVPFTMPGSAPVTDIAQADEAPATDETTAPATPEPTLAAADPSADTATDSNVNVSEEIETAVVAQPTTDAAEAATPSASGRVSVLDTGRVIIRRGDNLWTLSRRVYGLGVRYTAIYDANRDQIRDPALIFPGQVFDLPSPDAEWGEVPGVDALEPEQRVSEP